MSEIKINFNEILSLDFDNHYQNFDKQEEYFDYFFDLPGKEHYRLLSYLSTQFNNSNIIDIGTLNGHSALALAYNKTNKIHTFDIEKFVKNPKIENTENIIFHLDANLFDENVQNDWIYFIKNSPLIMLDVSPHNGLMEIDFYNFLKKIDYQGIVLFDDILHFQEMRENFWDKVPDEFKYDLTKYGHWSGTGLVVFNKNIKIIL
jgi:hypothetical protein